MDSLRNTSQQRRSRLFEQLGSFWHSVFGEPEQVRRLIAIDGEHRLVSQFESGLGNLTGNHRLGSRVEQMNVPFDREDIFQTGMQFFDNPSREYAYRSTIDATTAYGHYRIRYWGMFLGNIVPEAIQAEGRSLHLGTDFFVHGEFIYFRDNPIELFPNFQYLIRVGHRRDYRRYFNFFYRSDRSESDRHLRRYYRQVQSPHSLKAVLASLAGLEVTSEPQRLLDRIDQTSTGRTVYLFEKETIWVDYAHDQLTVGDHYPSGTVIGNGVEIHQRDRHDQAWWRGVDWKGGLLLDPLINGFDNIFLPDGNTIAYPAGQDAGSSNGSKVHARIKLTNDFYRERSYWDRVEKREKSSGYYLNSVIGLEEEVDSGDPNILDTFEKMTKAYNEANELNAKLGFDAENPDLAALPKAELVNALDAFFQAILGRKSMVVLFRDNELPNPEPAYRFLASERPVGTGIIVFAYGPEAVETTALGSDSKVSSSAEVADAAIISAADSFDGGLHGGERATISTERILE